MIWGSEIRLWFVCFCAKHYQKDWNLTKSTFTCSKSTRRPLEQDVKSVQLRHQNEANFFVLVSLLLTLNIFYTLLQFFCFNSEQVNAGRHMQYSFSYKQTEAVTHRCFSRKVFYKYLYILQEKIHVKVWLPLYWNHTSAWVFFCNYGTYLQQNASFREHICRTASVYRSKYRGCKCTGSL